MSDADKTVVTAVAARPYKDRHVGLTLFGIVLGLLGCVLFLNIPATILGQKMQAQMLGAPVDIRSMVLGCIVSALEGSVLIALGVGSAMARRWARALTLIVSWIWLIAGAMAAVTVPMVLPQVLANAPTAPGAPPIPDAVKSIIVAVAVAVILVSMVALPIGFILFYRSSNVKQTCEVRDRKPRWTDACPLPVLAMSLFFGVGSLAMIGMAAAINGVLPMFGSFISGPPGIAAYLVLGVIFAAVSRNLYKMKPIGWWLGCALFLVMTVSATMTYFKTDPIEIYRLAGYPERTIAQLQQMRIFDSAHFGWSTVIFGVIFLGYMAYVKSKMQGPVPS